MNRIVAAALNSRLLSFCCMLALLAAPALAQSEERLPPYDVQGLEHKRVWVPWVFAFLFAILTIFIAFKNPRRSHQD